MRRSVQVGAAVGLCAVAAPVVAQPAVWTIDPEPRLELGASPDDPRDQFGRVVDVAFGADGGLFILDGTPPAVRRFDSAGAPRPDLGGEGDGPGELRSPVAMVVRGDTVVVVGGDGRRAVFGPDGSIVGDDRMEMPRVCGPGWNPAMGGLLADGSAVVRCRERLFGRVRGEYRQTVGLVRVPPGAAAPDTLGWFPADTGRTDDGDPPIPRPYAPSAELLVDGAGGRVFVATSDRVRIEVLEVGGPARTAFDVPAAPRPTTPDDLTRHVESMLRVGGTANDQRVIREWAEGMPPAERTPVMRSLVAAGPDEMWVETWDDDGAGARWLVFDGRGALRAEVRAPPGAEIRAVGPDAVLAVWRDAFGVERIRVHGLERRRP